MGAMEEQSELVVEQLEHAVESGAAFHCRFAAGSKGGPSIAVGGERAPATTEQKGES